MFLLDWKNVLLRAWSVRFMALAAILSGAEVALAFWVPPWPSGVLAALSGVVTAAALVARFMVQKNMGDKG